MSVDIDPIASVSTRICAHMNDDHADSNLAYVQYFGDIKDASDATLLSVSSTGMELQYRLKNQPKEYFTCHIKYPTSLEKVSELRPVLIDMSDEAMKHLGLPTSKEKKKQQTHSRHQTHSHSSPTTTDTTTTTSTTSTTTSSRYSPSFQSVDPVITVTILILFYLHYCVSFNTDMPHSSLNWVRTLGFTLFRTKFVLQIVFYSAIIAHIFETLYAIILLKEKGIEDRREQVMWTIQTLLVGYPSLKLLLSMPNKSSVKLK